MICSRPAALLSLVRGLLTLLLTLPLGATGSQDPPPLVPWPMQVAFPEGEALDLYQGGRVVAEQAELLPLAELLADELQLLTGLALMPLRGEGSGGDIVLRLDGSVPAGGYRLAVGVAAIVRASDPAGVARGSAVLLQALRLDGTRHFLAPTMIEDAPGAAWHGVTLDCTRHLQSLEVLQQAVDFCRFYGLGPLHLVLADEDGFAFPSEALPQLVDPERHYSAEFLGALVSYAQLRGVELLPELDLSSITHVVDLEEEPGYHGIADTPRKPALGRVTKESTRRQVGRLLGELAEAFPHARCLHLGRDESWTRAIQRVPGADAKPPSKPMEQSAQFLAHSAQQVLALGRTPVLWEGRLPEWGRKLPKETVMFVTGGAPQGPADWVKAGFPVVNVSPWPLWQVNGGQLSSHVAPRSSEPEAIAAWNLRHWTFLAPKTRALESLQLSSDVPVQGAQFVLRGQTSASVVPSLRRRAAVFAERAWRADASPGASPLPTADLLERARLSDERLMRLLFPARIEGGEPYPDGRHWIAGPVRVVVASKGKVRYTLDGSDPTSASPEWTSDREFEAATTLSVRLFRATGEALGWVDRRHFASRPEARVRAQVYPAPPGGWTELPDFTRLKPSQELRFAGLRANLSAGAAGLVQRAQFVAPGDGDYRFELRAQGSLAQLSIDGQAVVEPPATGWEGHAPGSLPLSPGPHDLVLRLSQGVLSSHCQVFVSGPGIDGTALLDRYLAPLGD